MLHVTARCMSTFIIVERVCQDEIMKMADVQMEYSEDEIRIERIHVGNNGCLSGNTTGRMQAQYQKPRLSVKKS